MSTVVENGSKQGEQDWHMSEVMAWHGWGSPVGISVLLVSIGVTAALLRHALFG